MGSCRARSVYLTTLLLGRLSPLSGYPVLCTFFRQKLTTALLESAGKVAVQFRMGQTQNDDDNFWCFNSILVISRQ